MHVRKDLAIAPHEDGVTRHAHVELEVIHRVAVRVLHGECEWGELLRHKWCVATQPHNLCCRIVGGAPSTVVASERSASDPTRRKLSGHRLCDTSRVHHIREQFVLTCGYWRQRLFKGAGTG